MEEVRKEFERSREMLEKFIAGDENFRLIALAGDLMVNSLSAGGKIITCGNGGSMCDAMHFAEELTGRYRDDRRPLPAVAISDPAYITCAANDYGFDHIFSRFIEGTGKKGDVLMAISTSGNSANVVNAALYARKTDMKIVGLTGRDGGKLAGLCDIEIRAPFSDYSDRAQEIHVKIIHALIGYIEKNL